MSNIRINAVTSQQIILKKGETVKESDELINNTYKHPSEVILNISNESREKLEQNTVNKKRGETSKREEYEEHTQTIRKEEKYDVYGNLNPEYILRMYYPREYNEYMELWDKKERADAQSKSEIRPIKVLTDALRDFWSLKKNRVNLEKLQGDIDRLEKKYSDDVHTTIFDFFLPEAEKNTLNMWKYYSKFNVRMVYGYEDDGKTIEEAVRRMKQTELDYEGNLKNLQFGVKIMGDNSLVFGANYFGCRNDDGIYASSEEELLKMIKEDESQMEAWKLYKI